MSNYKPHVYLIRTLTNLHVGGGESNYDYVDKQVQRDPTTSFPTIHSSGLKGALRDHFDEKDPGIVNRVFGNEVTDSNSQQGNFRFLSAQLLSLPEPADDKPFQTVSAPEVKSGIEEQLTLMGGSLSLPAPDKPLGLDEFKELANELPVLARNNLDNGVSKNLWYEEVVPREAQFVFVVMARNDDDDFQKFNQHLDGKIVQIGANATIGYGLCHFKKLEA